MREVDPHAALTRTLHCAGRSAHDNFRIDLCSSVSTAGGAHRALTERFEGLIPLMKEVMTSG